MRAPGLTHGQRLAADAAAAAEVRGYQTDPDVVALRVERIRTQVERLMWTGMVLGLSFTMVNVQTFAAAGAPTGSLTWWAAWLLDPMVSLVLLGVLRAEQVTARWQVPMGPWPRVAKWTLLAGTYVMNTWSSWAVGSPAQVVLHSVPVLTVLVAAEAVTDCQDRLTECVHRAHVYATDRARHRATDQTDQRVTGPGGHPTLIGAAEQVRSASSGTGPGAVPVPSVAPVLTPVRAVPDRSDPTVGNRSGPPDLSVFSGRPTPASGNRSGPGNRTATTTPGALTRTDAQLSREVRKLAAQTGGRPSQYAIKQRLGVGSGRAARLLAELDTIPPAAPQSTKASTRKESAR